MRIREILKEKQMTQVALAAKLGISKQNLNNMITGVFGITLPMAGRMAEALGVPLWQMFASPDDVRQCLETPRGFDAVVVADGEQLHFSDPLALRGWLAERYPLPDGVGGNEMTGGEVPPCHH